MPTLLVRCPNRRDSFPCVLTDGIFSTCPGVTKYRGTRHRLTEESDAARRRTLSARSPPRTGFFSTRVKSKEKEIKSYAATPVQLTVHMYNTTPVQLRNGTLLGE